MKDLVLYIHGKGGSAGESAQFKPLFPGCEVMGLDYQTFTPWETGREIREAVTVLNEKYGSITLIANSIGAFFSMNAGIEGMIRKAYFISPIVDMERLILNMMSWSGVTEKELKEKGTIHTDLGEDLSWDYLCYVREHPACWTVPTRILYGGHDNLVSIETVAAFSNNHGAELTVMENGEHWFHTDEQMKFVDNWIRTNENTARDNQRLIDYWDQALSLSDADRAELRKSDLASWNELAPSKKLFEAACLLGKKKKVLDYGCGNAWAGIIAAKSGCPDVTVADAALGAVRTALYYASVYDVERQLHAVCSGPQWLKGVAENTYDGFFFFNVLDVVPTETALEIICESARITSPDAIVIIGMNFHLTPDAAAARGLELVDGTRLYVDGVLRLVSRSDEEWAELFSPWYAVERLTHFAWPGEAAETRRLFYLRKREASVRVGTKD